MPPLHLACPTQTPFVPWAAYACLPAPCRSVVGNFVCNIIIFIHLYDSGFTSIIVLLSAGVSTLIEAWKAQHGMAWHGMAWHSMAQHGIAWHGMAWGVSTLVEVPPVPWHAAPWHAAPCCAISLPPNPIMAFPASAR